MLLALVIGCGDGDGPLARLRDGDGTITGCGEKTLELVVTDVWAQPLTAELSGDTIELHPLDDEAAQFAVLAEAEDHLPATIDIDWDGQTVRVEVDGGRSAQSSDTRVIDGESCEVKTVYLGVDHAWFAGSGPAPSDNDVDVLINGKESWEVVYEDLRSATDEVFWATWWWESDFELIRPEGHYQMSTSARERYTAMYVLEDMPQVQKRLLINRFWGDNSDWLIYLNTDSDLRGHAEALDDFEVMLQGSEVSVPSQGVYEERVEPFSYLERLMARPEYEGRAWVPDEGGRRARELEVDAASWHQKAVVIDGEIAIVGGMNVKATDWDDEHEVFDERRMVFDASRSDREAVRDREVEPDQGPRRDYMIRVEGPVARDVEEILAERWQYGIDTSDLYANNASAVVLDEPHTVEHGALAQVTVTQPEPLEEQQNLEAHRKAFAQATEYIFIEDQYFRAPILNETIAARMLEVPELVLIVVTKPVSEWDGGLKYSYLTDQYFRDLFGDRYLVLQLKTADMVAIEGWVYDDIYWYPTNIDTHSKLRIIDDRYVSVGSCNFNNRGYLYEGEMNVSVLDTELARDTRGRVFEQLVGEDLAPHLSDDAQNNLEVLRTAAEYNEELFAWWDAYADDLSAEEAEDTWKEYPPAGFVHPVEFSSDYIEVGPDLF